MTTLLTILKRYLFSLRFTWFFKFFRPYDLSQVLVLYILTSRKTILSFSKRLSVKLSTLGSLIITKFVGSIISRSTLSLMLRLRLWPPYKVERLLRNLIFFRWVSWFITSYIESIHTFFQASNPSKSQISAKAWERKHFLCQNKAKIAMIN